MKKKLTINLHNKEAIMEKKAQAINCNCINRSDCPFSNQCQILNIIYKQKLHQIFATIMGKYTTEPAKTHLNSDMESLRNHSLLKNIGEIENFRRITGNLF